MAQTDPTINIEPKQIYEDLQVMGGQLLSRVQDIIREGNVRRIIIKQQDGSTVLEIPLTAGLVGALLAPQVAVIGTIGALLTQCSIQVVRSETAAEKPREHTEGYGGTQQ
ncbi:MAG: DUF4342 domain-containing protein [Ktedonobacteraceae bacterium]|nr:DUF4342 domain-containing protein [Ktedonobacteraceae bacterium]